MKTIEVRRQIEKTGMNIPIEQVKTIDLQTRMIIIASTDLATSRCNNNHSRLWVKRFCLRDRKILSCPLDFPSYFKRFHTFPAIDRPSPWPCRSCAPSKTPGHGLRLAGDWLIRTRWRQHSAKGPRHGPVPLRR